MLAIYRCTLSYLRASYRIERQDGAVTPAMRNEFMKSWAGDILELLDMHLVRRGQPPIDTPALFVGNHLSYLDIPVLLASVPVAFVAKQEIGSWPVFGSACRRTGTVLVQRDSAGSRRNAALEMARVIREERRSIAVFPAGTTRLLEDKPWRYGAFRLAKEHGIPLQPFRLTYEPLRKATYIGRDFFPLHLFQLLRQGRIKAVIEFGRPRFVEDIEAECAEIHAWAQEVHGRLAIGQCRGELDACGIEPPPGKPA